MKKLTLNKESVRVLVSNELDQVRGGQAVPTSSAIPSSALPGQGGQVSSIRPTSTAVGGTKVSSIRPTSTAVGGTKVSSIRPTSTAVRGR
jgi:hypothetical protein